MAWSTYGPTENSDSTRSQPSGPRARREPYPVRFRLIPWDSLRFMSPGESHKFMSQSELLKTGCTDRESRETSIPPSPRAPRPRERERMGVPSLGFMDIRGILRKWKKQKRTNKKIENSKKKGKLETHQNQKNRRQETHQKKKKRGVTGSHPRPTNQDPKTHQSKNIENPKTKEK